MAVCISPDLLKIFPEIINTFFPHIFLLPDNLYDYDTLWSAAQKMDGFVETNINLQHSHKWNNMNKKRKSASPRNIKLQLIFILISVNGLLISINTINSQKTFYMFYIIVKTSQLITKGKDQHLLSQTLHQAFSYILPH